MGRSITIVDYGLGNIFSVSRAISYLGFDLDLATTPEHIDSADFLVLPGVGAFNRGMYELRSRDLVEPIKKHIKLGKPLLGICLGMQFLFDSSEESDKEVGFGFIPGRVVRVVPEDSLIKVPHIGWSCLTAENNLGDAGLVSGREYIDNRFVYFVHSYHPDVTSKYLLATTRYQGHSVNAVVKKENVIGCQFHPEKSGEHGKAILNYFLQL